MRTKRPGVVVPAFKRPRRQAWIARAAEWALRARFVPVLPIFFRAYYRSSLMALDLWLIASRLPVSGLWLRRGLARKDWTPGGSDVDLAVELPDMSVKSEMLWLDRWDRGFRRLRALFPFLGETQIARRDEWSLYLKGGDIRARELPHEAKPVRGPGLPLAASGASPDDVWRKAKTSIDAWTEQLHAYTRLSQLYFQEGGDLRAAYNARKSLLDIARYGRLFGLGPASGRKSYPGEALTRSETAALCRDDAAAGSLLNALETARDEAAIGAAIEAAFLQASGDLEDSARSTLARIPNARTPLKASSDRAVFPHDWEMRVFTARCRMLEKATEGLLTGAHHDNMHLWRLRFSQGGASAPARQALRALRGLKKSENSLSQTILPLPPHAFRLSLWGPYLEDPLQALPVMAALRDSSGENVHAYASGDSPLMRRHVLCLWKLSAAGISAPPRPLFEMLFHEALTHLLVNWRSAGGPANPENDHHRWVYLYGRVLSHRLYAETGEVWSSFPLAPLARRFVEAFPEERPHMEAHVLKASSIGSWGTHRLFFARQLRAATAGMNSRPVNPPGGSAFPLAGRR